MPSFIGAITLFMRTKGESSFQVFRAKIDVWLKYPIFLGPLLKCYLNDLQFNLINSSYSRDNRLNSRKKLTF